MERTLRFANLAAVPLLALLWLSLQVHPYDGSAAAYYLAELGPELYAREWNADPHAYVYPPPFRQVIEPLTWLPWPAFYAIWTGGLLVALGWLVSPALAVLLLVPWEPFRHGIATGDVTLLMAVALCLRPAAWAVLPLLKVTPGVAFAWFAVRREWRLLLEAMGMTAAVFAASFLLDPQLWPAWWERMVASVNAEVIGLALPAWVRLPVAAGVVALGAWRGWRWLLPVGVLLAQPNLAWTSLVVLAALPRLVDGVEAERAEVDAEARRVNPHQQRVLS